MFKVNREKLSLKNLNNNIIVKGIILIFLIAELVFMGLGYFFYKVSYIDILKYIYFQIVFIFLQGAFILRIFQYNGKKEDYAIISYAVGNIICIAQYYFCKRFIFVDAAFFMGNFIGILELLLASINYFKYKHGERKVKETRNIIIVFIAILVVLIGFIGVTVNNPLPNVIGTSTYSGEILKSIGDAQSFVRNVVPIDSRISQVPLLEKSILAMQLAVISDILNVNSYTIMFNFLQIGNLLFLLSSLYLTMKSYFNNKLDATVSVVMYFFMGSAALIFISKGISFGNESFKNLFLVPSDFSLIMSYVLLLMYILLKQGEDLDVKYIIYWILFFIPIVLGNANIALVIILSLIIGDNFIRKNRKLKQRISKLVILSITIFLILVFVFLGKSHFQWTLSFGDIWDNSFLGNIITELKYSVAPIGMGILGGILIVLIEVLYVIFGFLMYLPPVTLILILWIRKRLKKKKLICIDSDGNEVKKNIKKASFEIKEVFIIIITMLSIIICVFFRFNTTKQIQLLMFTIPFMEIIAITYLKENFNSINKFLKFILILGFIVSVTTTGCYISKEFKSGAEKFISVKNQDVLNKEVVKDGISKYEYEAMQWLDLNISDTDIVLTNKIFKSENSNQGDYYYYSAFSSKQMYLEAWQHLNSEDNLNDIEYKKDLISKAYSSNKEAVKQLRKEGVRYIVVSKLISPKLQMDKALSEKVFENRDIIIYELK